METSPTLSSEHSRVRATLLATSVTGVGPGDKRVVFLGSSPFSSGDAEAETWYHDWLPNLTEHNHQLPENSLQSDNQSKMSGGAENPNNLSLPIISHPSITCNSSETCTPQGNEQHHPLEYNNIKIGVHGWRKRCLYFLVFGLMIMIVSNLALTLWLLKVTEFSSEGIGSLKIVPSGVQLGGQAAILDDLIASSISSRRGKNLILESWSNFSTSARSTDGRLLGRINLGEERVDCVTKSFRIINDRGEILFSANRELVSVGAMLLKVTGVAGAMFHGSVQTPLVRSESGFGLRLESSTRALEIRASDRVIIESRAGQILASCVSDLMIQSVEGSIEFDAKTISFKGLIFGRSAEGRLSEDHFQQHESSWRSKSFLDEKESVHQLCACADGKLFLGSPEGMCQADNSIC